MEISLENVIDIFKLYSGESFDGTDLRRDALCRELCEGCVQETMALPWKQAEEGQEDSRAAEKLAAEGIGGKVVNLHTIKPIDEELVGKAASETGRVVTVEEHSVIGGLGSAVCDVLSAKAPTKVMKIGINDTYGESGPAKDLVKKYGLDGDSIAEKVKAFVK